jgi:disulfide bond formation protein DsbB
VTSNLRLAQRVAIAVPALALAGAFLSEYAGGLPPCEMCWWQRYAHLAALGLALAALPLSRIRAGLLSLAALAICLSGVIGGFHAGVEYGWWPGITTCAQPTGLAGGGDPLAAIMAAPLVRCDVAPWTLLGVSLAGWNALYSMLAGLGLFRLLGLRERP